MNIGDKADFNNALAAEGRPSFFGTDAEVATAAAFAATPTAMDEGRDEREAEAPPTPVRLTSALGDTAKSMLLASGSFFAFFAPWFLDFGIISSSFAASPPARRRSGCQSQSPGAAPPPEGW
jgi:hypothetical protein